MGALGEGQRTDQVVAAQSAEHRTQGIVQFHAACFGAAPPSPCASTVEQLARVRIFVGTLKTSAQSKLKRVL